ncbi:MAG TPA: transcription termination/antitermination protein NusG [Planctomycetaceae bacterium]|nr:transcription termination/antitermination protein NusG [Planctomycetaceae bacterium]
MAEGAMPSHEVDSAVNVLAAQDSGPEDAAGAEASEVDSRVEAPVAPVQEVAVVPSSAAEAPSEPMLWYVLKVQSNRERTIKDSLLRRIRRDSLERFFGEIVIPTEKVVETKNGKKRTMERKLYPGYIMVNMVLNDETWYLVRDTGGVGDFTGAAGKPLPMRDEEINALLNRQSKSDEGEPAKVKIAFARGDTVKIKEGTFESFEGSIEGVDEASGKVSVLIEIFGRSTPVELEHWQVERI